MKSKDGKKQKKSEEKVRERKGRKRKKVKEEQVRESQKKEDAGARTGRKATKHYVFPMSCGSGRLKSRLPKAAGAEPAGQRRDEKKCCGAKHISESKC